MKRKKGKAVENDILIGQKIRQYRHAKSLSQIELAVKCDITFQQIQKYENGKNRVSVSRLIDISNVLAVPLVKLLPDDFESKDKIDPIEENREVILGNLKTLIQHIQMTSKMVEKYKK